MEQWSGLIHLDEFTQNYTLLANDAFTHDVSCVQLLAHVDATPSGRIGQVANTGRVSRGGAAEAEIALRNLEKRTKGLVDSIS